VVVVDVVAQPISRLTAKPAASADKSLDFMAHPNSNRRAT